MPCLVPVVQTYIKDVWIALRQRIDHRPRPLRVGDVPHRWNPRLFRRRNCRIYRINVEIFIARLILRIEKIFAVAAPEIPRNRRFVSALIGFAAAKGSSAFFTQMFRVPLYGFRNEIYFPSGEICAAVIFTSPKNASRSISGGSSP